jgi:hypothetical protein
LFQWHQPIHDIPKPLTRPYVWARPSEILRSIFHNLFVSHWCENHLDMRKSLASSHANDRSSETLAQSPRFSSYYMHNTHDHDGICIRSGWGQAKCPSPQSCKGFCNRRAKALLPSPTSSPIVHKPSRTALHLSSSSVIAYKTNNKILLTSSANWPSGPITHYSATSVYRRKLRCLPRSKGPWTSSIPHYLSTHKPSRTPLNSYKPRTLP